MDRIKVGVIGTGCIGPVHVEGLQRNSGLVQVIGIAGTSTDKAKAVAQAYGIPQYYGDYKKLLMDREIQAVHICTPNHLHFPMVKMALDMGKHVVCEKPLTVTRKEGETLIALARKNQCFHAVHFNLRYYPLVQNLRVKIASGHLGKLTAVHGGFLQDWLLFESDYNWRMEPEKAGSTRVMGDIGSHWLDMIEFLTGERVKSVCADFSTVLPKRNKPEGEVQTFARASNDKTLEYEVKTEDHVTMIFRMSGGIHGSAVFSQVSAGRKCYLNFEINGRNASAAWNSEAPNQMWYGSREGYNSIQMKDYGSTEKDALKFQSYPGGHQEGFGDTVKQFCRQFYHAITHGTKPDVPDFYDGLREVVVCDAVLESARKGQWVNIEEMKNE